MSIVTKLHTVCMVLQGDKVPESPGDGAIREVREETGLVVRALTTKACMSL